MSSWYILSSRILLPRVSVPHHIQRSGKRRERERERKREERKREKDASIVRKCTLLGKMKLPRSLVRLAFLKASHMIYISFEMSYLFVSFAAAFDLFSLSAS
jgi:hypothetical protein